MKFTLIILTVLAPFFAHAGGGGGLRPGMQTMMMNSPEIVFHMGQKDGFVKFAYGHLEGNQWQIQRVQVPKNELTLAPEETSALEKSEITKDWVYIK